MDDLRAAKSEDVGLIDPPTSQTDRQTDTDRGHAIARPRFAI